MAELRQRLSKVQPAVVGLEHTRIVPEINGGSHKVNSRFRLKDAGSTQWNHLALICLLYTVLVYALYRGLVIVPSPLGLDAPDNAFSEARALQTTAHLSEDIGRRMVTMPALARAADYVESRAKELQELAIAYRPDLVVEVDREQTSGAFNLVFINTPISNAYNNLTNIILRIAPKDALHRKAVLINAHFDSVFESPGASDCAACVGTALEVARVIVADPSIKLAAPLVLLLNGGEETVLTAAHGFMAGSKWVDGIGAFINLESTGPGGPDVLFQHTGSWTLDAYTKGAKHPRGSVFAQDFFESRLMSMDTDFRMFSADYLGRLPGIDIAQVLDGAAYHSHQDTVDRIRKGTIQMLGDNVLGITVSFAEALKHQEEHGLPDWDAKGSVYFDLLGHRMISYPIVFGRLVHSLALPAVLIAIALLPRAKAGPRPFMTVLRGAGIWLAAVILGMALPAAMGALRVMLTGKPIIWFGRTPMAYAIYLPAALAGILLPYAAFPPAVYSLDAAVLGVALVRALETAGLTALGMKSTFAFALWAFAAAAASALFPGKDSVAKLLWALLTALPALLGVSPFVSSLSLFLAEHMSIGGAGQPPLGNLAADVALGLLFGAVAAFTLGHLAVWIAQAIRPRIWRVVVLLLLVSAAAAAHASRPAHPYSRQFPKRVMLQHLHVLSPTGDVQESKWTVGALDVIPIEKVLPEGQEYLAYGEDDWQALYPVEKLMRWVALPAPPASKDLYKPGSISIELDHADPAARPPTNASRLHLVMHLPWPGWGLLNVTGPVAGWSFSPGTKADEAHITRFCGNDGSQHWPFWLDSEGDWRGNVRVELSVMSLQNTTELDAFASSLPQWTTVSQFTAFKTAFTF